MIMVYWGPDFDKSEVDSWPNFIVIYEQQLDKQIEG